MERKPIDSVTHENERISMKNSLRLCIVVRGPREETQLHYNP